MLARLEYLNFISILSIALFTCNLNAHATANVQTQEARVQSTKQPLADGAPHISEPSTTQQLNNSPNAPTLNAPTPNAPALNASTPNSPTPNKPAPNPPSLTINNLTLRPHPRVIVTNSTIARVQKLIRNDKNARQLFHEMQSRANQMLTAPPAHYSDSPPVQLMQARLALKNITTLAGMFRLTNDRRYFERARAETLALTQFPNWGPTNFLCVAENSAAMAIGYDWLYAELSASDKSAIVNAIETKSLALGNQQYNENSWWTRSSGNWNLVCNSGLTLASLAIAEADPPVASETLSHATHSIKSGMETFEPDGGYPEGPAYWTYGTRYLFYYLASLETAFENVTLIPSANLSKIASASISFNLDTSIPHGIIETPRENTNIETPSSNTIIEPSRRPAETQSLALPRLGQGLAATGFFRIYTSGPTGKSFNFADGDDEIPRGAQMFWFSTKFGAPEFAGAELQVAETFPEMFHLLMYTPKHKTPEQARLPLSRKFDCTALACFRSDWTKNAMFIGIKGGTNKISHAHLDLGTFVLDSDGYRWALDLGPDSYELPGYFGTPARWNYYRLRTEGHNTLTVENNNQNPTATASLTSFSAGRNPDAIIDLTDAYKPALSHVTREVTFNPHRKSLTTCDEVDAPASTKIVWHFHTQAVPTLSSDARTATLVAPNHETKSRLIAEIISPAHARFVIQPTHESASETPNTGVKDLTIPVQLEPGVTRIRVRLRNSRVD